MQRSLTYALYLGLFVALSTAQLPSAPTDVTVVDSQVDSKATISYKETDVCERTPGVKSYSGFVHLPASLLSDVGDYDINTYFIYFEARNNASTAPLAIYLAGGPGESSLYAALSSESGPCYVNINGTDTIHNPWSFNNNANVLYIDQPVQSGFSYDTLVNATSDLLSADGLITPVDFSQSPLPVVNASFGYGTFPSQNYSRTVNNTVQAARALWHFAEHWMSSFPGYTTLSNEISIWGNSYGGYWVPETAVQFSKNLESLPCGHPLESKNLTIDAVGITNGCIDIQSAAAGYPEYAYNNTYGIQFGSEAIYEGAMQNLTMPGGCQDLISQCRALGELSDPDHTGSNATVNEVCMEALGFCQFNVIGSFPDLQLRVPFDIAIPQPNPCDFYLPVSWYLNNASTQLSLGVPLNFTYDSNVVAANFGFLNPFLPPTSATPPGDPVRQNGLPNLSHLLTRGVKVALLFGDRDYRCPWTGGEASALATPWPGQPAFAAAGYQELAGVRAPADQGGSRAVVKQAGLLSFVRVLDAGHQVSAYAPETVWRVFDRTLRGVDVVGGGRLAGEEYATTGPAHSWGWRNVLPEEVPRTCVVAGAFQEANPWEVVGPVPPPAETGEGEEV